MKRVRYLRIGLVMSTLAGWTFAAPIAPGIAWAQVAVLPPGSSGTSANTSIPLAIGVPAAGIVAGAIAGGQAGSAGTSAPPPAGTSAGVVVPLPGAVAPGQQMRAPVSELPQRSGAIAPSPPATSLRTPTPGSKAAACVAVLQTERISMPHKGGNIEVKANFTGAPCTPVVVSNWVHATGTADAGVYRFTVEPNHTARMRQTVLLFGDQRFTIGQAGRSGPGIAASPGKLEFNLKRRQSRKMAFLAWSDGPNPD